MIFYDDWRGLGFVRVLRDHSLSYAVLLPLSMDENRVELMLNSHGTLASWLRALPLAPAGLGLGLTITGQHDVQRSNFRRVAAPALVVVVASSVIPTGFCWIQYFASLVSQR